MRGLVQIFAVGGGGFTHSQDGDRRDMLLEDRLLALVGPVAKLKIGYIGHANNDRADRLKAFYTRFEGCARTTHLPITADAAMAQDFLQDPFLNFASSAIILHAVFLLFIHSQ